MGMSIISARSDAPPIPDLSGDLLTTVRLLCRRPPFSASLFLTTSVCSHGCSLECINGFARIPRRCNLQKKTGCGPRPLAAVDLVTTEKTWKKAESTKDRRPQGAFGGRVATSCGMPILQ